MIAQAALHTLAGACETQGLPELGVALTALADAVAGSSAAAAVTSDRRRLPAVSATSTLAPLQPLQPPQGPAQQFSKQQQQQHHHHHHHQKPSELLEQLLSAVCAALARSLLPTYADWLLRFWVGLLLLPGAAALHPPTLLLLSALFRTPGLTLGSAAVLLLDPGFLSPLVGLSQVCLVLKGWGIMQRNHHTIHLLKSVFKIIFKKIDFKTHSATHTCASWPAGTPLCAAAHLSCSAPSCAPPPAAGPVEY
jgi:hypothetical protein